MCNSVCNFTKAFVYNIYELMISDYDCNYMILYKTKTVLKEDTKDLI